MKSCTIPLAGLVHKQYPRTRTKSRMLTLPAAPDIGTELQLNVWKGNERQVADASVRIPKDQKDDLRLTTVRGSDRF